MSKRSRSKSIKRNIKTVFLGFRCCSTVTRENPLEVLRNKLEVASLLQGDLPNFLIWPLLSAASASVDVDQEVGAVAWLEKTVLATSPPHLLCLDLHVGLNIGNQSSFVGFRPPISAAAAEVGVNEEAHARAWRQAAAAKL